MDQSQSQIDQLFRSKLGNYAVTPPDRVWSGIVRRRKNAGLRRKLLLGLIILLLLALLAWILLPAKSGGPAMVSGEQLPPTGVGEAVLGSAIGESDFIPDMAEVDGLDAQLMDAERSPIQEYTGTSATDELATEEIREMSESFQGAGEDISAGQSEYANTGNGGSSIGGMAENAGSVESVSESNFAPDFAGIAGEEAAEENPIANLPEASFHPSEPQAEEESSFVRESAVAFLYGEKWRENLGHRAEQEKKSALSINYCAIRNNPNCFEPAIPLRYFALDLLAGPDFFSKTLNPASEEYRDWADARAETESYVISYGATARVSAILQNGFALRTGVSVNQINERFRFVDPDEERRRVVNVLIDTIINAPMDTTFVFDTLSVIESGQRVRTVYNQYRMIDIPVMFGYEFNSGNWTFAPSAGVMFNLAFATRGEIISSSGHPVSIPEGESGGSIFRARLGMSIAGSFGVGYRLDSRYSVMVEPRFIYRFNPITLSNQPIEQNYFTYGVQAGIRYRFR